jgi:hypothetical protein
MRWLSRERDRRSHLSVATPSRHLAFALVTVTIYVSAVAVRAQFDQQTLAGATLQPIEDAETLVSDLLDRFVGGSRDSRGTIDRVVVQEDSPRRLVLEVTYSGLTNCRLSGELRGRDRRPQMEIRSEAVQLASGTGAATIAFDAQNLADDGTLQSAYVRLTAIDRDRPVLSRIYRLPKRWQAGSGSGNTFLKIVPQPIGTAASLGSRPDYAQPPKVLVPIAVRDHRNVAAPAGRTGAAQATPGAIVRDHRGTGAAGSPVVRDHRGDGTQPAAQGAARDNRDASGATVRDHRDSAPATVRDHRSRTIAQTRPATAKLPTHAAVKQLDRFQYGVKPEDAQKGAQGPAPAPIELLEGLRTEDIGLNPALLLSVASTIYPDKNPSSGVFYYTPRAYHLEWSPENGHSMRILYGAATAAGASGDVLMAAQLQSGLDFSEIQLATDLLTAYVRRNPSGNVPRTVLRPLPLEKDGVDISLGAVLGQYSIPKEKIAVTGLSDVLGEIEVSWVTDPITKENLQLALEQGVGVNGTVAFAATGGALEPQIPIAIQLADRDSFGRARWNRTEGYRNVTPYPIRLRYLHALVIDPRTNLPILYSWTLGNAEIAPGGRVQWDATKVPAWVDTEAKRLWVDYSVVDSCAPCDKQVLDAITGGVTSIAAEQITFHTITPLAEVGGYELTAVVRSRYFDPGDRAMTQKSVVLKADNQDFTLRPIYNGSVRAGEPLFEYLLELAMPDGRTYRGSRWIPSDSLRVLIGRSQLEQSLGTLPGRQQ